MLWVDAFIKSARKGSFVWRVSHPLLHALLDYTEVVRYESVLPLVRGDKVVDVGAGFGKLAVAIQRAHPGAWVVALESDPALYKFYTDTMAVVLGSGLRLPFKDGAFETVVSTDVLEHIPPSKRAAFIHELSRVSNKRIVLTVPIAHAWVNQILHQILPQFLRPGWLSEHESYGVPAPAQVERIFSENGLSIVSSRYAIGELGWLLTLLQHVLLIPVPKTVLRFLQNFDAGRKTWACYCLEKR